MFMYTVYMHVFYSNTKKYLKITYMYMYVYVYICICMYMYVFIQMQ